MNCVHCPEATLVPYQIENVQIDLCPECKGFWFDSGEIERCLQMPAHKVRATFGEAGHFQGSEGVKGQPRPCPRCGQTMEKQKTQQIWVDLCPAGHGIWLDSGEMSLIYEKLHHRPAPLSVDPRKEVRVSALADFLSLSLNALLGPLRPR